MYQEVLVNYLLQKTELEAPRSPNTGTGYERNSTLTGADA